MEDIEYILTCSICMEFFEHPRMIPCQHTFCKKCLTDFVRSNSKKKHKFACPLCRANITLKKHPFDGSEFPVNLTLQAFLDSKELIHTLENQNKGSTFGARTIASQTEPKSVDIIHITKPNITTDNSRMFMSVDNEVIERECLSQYFTFQNVPNPYETKFRRKMGSVLLEGNIYTCDLVCLLMLYIIFVLGYLLLACLAWAFECKSIFLNISILAAIIQLYYVRIKIDITMFRKRLFALNGFILAYLTTVLILCCLYLLLAGLSCNFCLFQKYGYTIEEHFITTPEGPKIIQTKLLNASFYVTSRVFMTEHNELMQDYVFFINAYCSKFWTELYFLIQHIGMSFHLYDSE